jgi:hypothetical protein
MSKIVKQTDLSGMLGRNVTVREVGNKTLVSSRPRYKLKGKTEKQLDFQEKFQEAAQYAKRQIAIDESRVLYESGITTQKRSAFVVAVTDYLKAPRVKSLDVIGYRGVIGNTITVVAKDDFMVTKVVVIITDATGAILEQGEAAPDVTRADHWQYNAVVANPSLTGTRLEVIAYDRPGNTGRASKVL